MNKQKVTTARMIALDAVTRVREKGAYLHVVLPQLLEASDLSPEDRALATEISYGTVRRRGSLDFVISFLSKNPQKKLPVGVRDILDITLYQILYLDRVPAYAAIDQAVEMVRKTVSPGFTGFVNAICRSADRSKAGIPWPSFESDPLMHLTHRHSLPQWLSKMWIEERGAAEAHMLAEAYQNPSPTSIRVNTIVASRPEVEKELTEGGAVVKHTRLLDEALVVEGSSASVGEGTERYTRQSVASMLASVMLEPHEGETVLDLCAAPGGKSTHIAALMNNAGRIVAMDKNEKRLARLTDRAERLGASIIEPLVADGTIFQEDLAASFDRVLIDAPCSGLGTLSSRPDIRWNRKESELDALAALQRRLLETGSKYVKPGGTLVYSTCTLSRQENQDNVEWAAENLGLHECDIEFHGHKPLHFRKGDGWVELLPDADDAIQGFFISKFRKG